MKKSSALNLLQEQQQFILFLKKNHKSLNTIKNYQFDFHCFNDFISKYNPSLNIDFWGESEVHSFGQYLKERHPSSNSQRRRLQAIRIFFDYLVNNNKIPTNPLKAIPSSPKILEIPKPTSFSQIKTIWTFLLAKELETTGIEQLIIQRNQLIFLLIFTAGLKVSDLAELKKKNLFLKAEPRVLIHQKHRDDHSVPLPTIFIPIFQQYEKNLTLFLKNTPIEFARLLFNANHYQIISGGITPRGIELIFEDWRQQLMVDANPKSLRQAAIFKWMSTKKTDSQIKEWLGLAPSYSLKHYRNLLDQHQYNEEFLVEIYQHYSLLPR